MFTREIHGIVREIIDTRREHAEAIATERTERLHRESRELREVDGELSKTGLLIFRAALSGSDLSPIRKRNEELLTKRREILASLGYPEDYTEPKYTCPSCQDTGKLESGKSCSCMKELLRIETIKASGIGRLIEKQSFENFDLEWYGKGSKAYSTMQENYNFCKKFAESFDGTKGSTLVFIGNTGTGKTHLSTAVAKTVIEKGYSVLYDSAQNIIHAFEEDQFGKDKYRFSKEPYEPKAEKYLSADLLIVDDLGTEFSNQFTVSCLYNLLNTRQNRGLSTVVSTNLSPDELSSKYEGRIFSRLVGSDSTILLFVGKDHRLG